MPRKNYTRPDTIRKGSVQQKMDNKLSLAKNKLRWSNLFKFLKNCHFCNIACSKEKVLGMEFNNERRDTIIPGGGKPETKSYSSQYLYEHLKNEIPHFLFIHGIGEYDTTLSVFQQKKKKMKYLKAVQKKNSELRQSLLVSNNEILSNIT